MAGVIHPAKPGHGTGMTTIAADQRLTAVPHAAVRTCSSAMRSEGFTEWKAPAQMNRMWSVDTLPCLVDTTEPCRRGGVQAGVVGGGC